MQGNEGDEKLLDDLVSINHPTVFWHWGKFPSTAKIVGRIMRGEGRIIAYIIVESLDEHVF